MRHRVPVDRPETCASPGERFVRAAENAGPAPATTTTRALTNAANASARPSTAAAAEPLEIGWNERAQHADRNDRKRRTQRAASDRKHAALNQQQSHERTPSRAERRAHGQLPAAIRAAGEQQIRHIRTTDEKQNGDGAKKQLEHGPRSFRERFTERFDGRPVDAGIPHGSLGGAERGQRIDFLARGLDRASIGQPANHDNAGSR